MTPQRDTLFIGHANPEDNEFTLWLYHKLANEGYEVACDLVSLTGGESDFWKTLQDILETKTCKYLLVFSKKTFKKQGVIDEWEQVRAIAKKHHQSDFVSLLKIDDVAFDDRIGTVTMNQFRFDKSWAGGLKSLMKKLHLDQVPRKTSPLSLNDWLKNKFTTESAGLKRKEEKYHSNWIEIVKTPQTIQFFRYANDTQAKAIHEEIDTFPVIQHDSYLISFLKTLPTESIKHKITLEPKEVFSLDTAKCHNYFDDVTFPNFYDLRNFMVRLLKESFSLYLSRNGLIRYSLSSNNNCFYYPQGFRPENRIHFQFNGKNTRKDLVGDYYDSFWHYAISFRPLYQPYFCFAIKGHLVFSEDGFQTWDDKNKQHSARRDKGKRFFNKEWRSMLLAFLHSLNAGDATIHLPGNETDGIDIMKEPMVFYGEIGYSDPKDKAREVPIDFFEKEDEEEGPSGNFESQYEHEEDI